ncbi:hypothetical protein ABMA28_012262 [Loxostege sticticalis]|uniref:Chitin-binding type-2 domain-containing protein n=1 Tax=Loxostege sticticalis TaxID=481309 RepID=A0ABD0TMK3_LOXSC
MIKIVLLLFVLAVCGRADDNSTDSGTRQKRAMLFFDDNGSLMKSFANPYMQMLAQYAALKPEHTNFLEYFFNFLRPLIINTSAAAYMIPVSEDVIQQINKDPVYQNRLTISKRGPDFNPLCAGQRTQIPSPRSCNSFLSCWDGWAYELDCPEGLMFSSEGYCDYADMVACKDRAVEDPVYQNWLTISKRGPDFNPLCAGQRTQIPCPSSCNSFLSCWDGWAYELDCPEGLMFSSEGYCDYADMVACKDRAVAVPNPIMPTCKTDFETFRNELNCNEFFVCVNRKPVKFQCPADLAYSQKFGVCDYPALVDCSSSSTFIQPPSPAQPASSDSAPAVPELPALTTKPFLPRPGKPGSIVNLPTIPAVPPTWTRPAPQEGEAPGFQFNPNLSDGNAIFMQNSIYNSHKYETPIAIMSPQDAIRYLKLNNIPEVSSSQ